MIRCMMFGPDLEGGITVFISMPMSEKSCFGLWT